MAREAGGGWPGRPGVGGPGGWGGGGPLHRLRVLISAPGGSRSTQPKDLTLPSCPGPTATALPKVSPTLPFSLPWRRLSSWIQYAESVAD